MSSRNLIGKTAVRWMLADSRRLLAAAVLCAGIGAGVNLLRKSPLAWNYQDRDSRFQDEMAEAAAGSGAGVDGGRTGGAAMEEMGLQELRAAMDSGAVWVVDARQPLLFRAGHLPGAVNLPREGFAGAWARHQLRMESARGRVVVIYCQGGTCEDSHTVASGLAKLGFGRVKVYRGGWKEWQAAGLPVEKGG